MISADTKINAIFYEKYMTAQKLQTILAGLRPDDKLFPNGVGNLRVERNGEVIGYIDFAEEEYAIITKN